MKQGRKHGLSPEKSPNPGRYEENDDEEGENLLERSIKKLKIDSDSHVNVPFSRPINKRFPTHVEEPDDPNYMHDINFPEVNKVLNELAVIREFREKVRKLRESKTMHTISENAAYVYHEDVAQCTKLQPPHTPLDFAPYDHEEGSQSSCSSSSHMEVPMDTDMAPDHEEEEEKENDFC